MLLTRLAAATRTMTLPAGSPWLVSLVPTTSPAPSSFSPTPPRADSSTATLLPLMAAGPLTEVGKACACTNVRYRNRQICSPSEERVFRTNAQRMDRGIADSVAVRTGGRYIAPLQPNV